MFLKQDHHAQGRTLDAEEDTRTAVAYMNEALAQSQRQQTPGASAEGGDVTTVSIAVLDAYLTRTLGEDVSALQIWQEVFARYAHAGGSILLEAQSL